MKIILYLFVLGREFEDNYFKPAMYEYTCFRMKPGLYQSYHSGLGRCMLPTKLCFGCAEVHRSHGQTQTQTSLPSSSLVLNSSKRKLQPALFNGYSVDPTNAFQQSSSPLAAMSRIPSVNAYRCNSGIFGTSLARILSRRSSPHPDIANSSCSVPIPFTLNSLDQSERSNRSPARKAYTSSLATAWPSLGFVFSLARGLGSCTGRLDAAVVVATAPRRAEDAPERSAVPVCNKKGYKYF